MKYSEHEKMSAVADKSQATGEFLEWLFDTKGYVLCETREDTWHEQFDPVNSRIENLLAEFYGVDLNLVEKEKRHMLVTYWGEELEKP